VLRLRDTARGPELGGMRPTLRRRCDKRLSVCDRRVMLASRTAEQCTHPELQRDPHSLSYARNLHHRDTVCTSPLPVVPSAPENRCHALC